MTLRSSVRRAAVCGALIFTASFAHAGHFSSEATVDRFVAPDGQNYFAVAVRAESLPIDRAPRTHAILVDTSASQVGEHRTQAFRILDQVLTGLKATDRVRLFAVDSQIQELTNGAVTANGPGLKAAVAGLHRRVPLGASDFLKSASLAEKSLASVDRADIVYIGDGMSTARLVGSEELIALVSKLRERRIPVHSYAVGPRTDIRLLGAITQYTGGILITDNSNNSSAGSRLVKAIYNPVFYPAVVRMNPSPEQLLPAASLPIRMDRETIFIGRNLGTEPLVVKASNRDGEFTWHAKEVNSNAANAFLLPLVKKAENSNGLTALPGRDILNQARDEFMVRVEQMNNAAQAAIENQNEQEAELIAAALENFDPAGQRTQTMLVAMQEAELLDGPLDDEEDEEDQDGIPGLEPPDPAPADDDAAAAGDGNELPQLEIPANQENLLDKYAPPTDSASDGLGPANPNEPNLIDEQEKLRQIRLDRLRLEVSRVLEQAKSIRSTEPDIATNLLKEALESVRSSSDIDPNGQRDLSRRVESALEQVENERDRIDLERARRAESISVLEAQRALLTALEDEERELETLIDQVRGLLDDARHGNDEAYEEAEAVSRVAVDIRPGNGPAAAALFSAEANGQLNKAFRLRELRYDRFLETLYQVEKSHVPFPDEPPIQWPEAGKWRALTERRRKWASVDLAKDSPAAQRITSELEKPIEPWDFDGNSLTEVIEFLKGIHEFEIQIDQKAFADEGYDAETMEFTSKLSGISLRSALKLLLEENPDYDLTYVIEDEVMKITTAVAAEEKVQVRVYPVGDLVVPIIQLGGGGQGGGFGGGQGGGFGGGQGGGGFGGGQGGGGLGGGAGQFSIPAEQPSQATLDALKKAEKAVQSELHSSISAAPIVLAQADDKPQSGFSLSNKSVNTRKKK